MSDALYLVKYDLTGDPQARWAALMVARLETLLAKHAAFEDYYTAREEETDA